MYQLDRYFLKAITLFHFSFEMNRLILIEGIFKEFMECYETICMSFRYYT